MGEWIPTDLPMLPPVGILAYLSSKSLEDLATYGKYEKVEPGEVLIQEGGVQSRLYIVVEGTLQISGLVSGQEIVYGQIEPGECLGEVSLFEEGTASATVRANIDSILWSLDINELVHYLTEHLGGGGALLMGIARCLSHRIKVANLQVAKAHARETPTSFSYKTTPLRHDAVPTAQTFLSKLSSKLKRVEDPKTKISTEIKL